MVGFSDADFETLDALQKDTLKSFTYSLEPKQEGMKLYQVADYWQTDTVLKGSVLFNKPFKGSCDSFAAVCLRKAELAGFTGRLVVCLDELKEGHCIAEIVSKDGTQAYYFDNRRTGIAAQQGLIGYYFLGASPWNPQPGDTRPWVLIDKQAA